MLILTVVGTVLGVGVGFARGGSLARLARVDIRLPWLAAIAWVLQALLFVSPLADALDPWAALIHLGTLVLIAAVIWANRRVQGIAVFGVGLLLNAAVYLANGGFMPVSDTALRAAGNEATLETMRQGVRVQKTFLMAPDTPGWFLGDVLPFPPGHKVYSPGDVIAAGGVFLLVAGGMGRRERTASSFS